MKMISNKSLIIIVALLSYILLLFTLPLDPLLTKGLSLFIFIAILWLTEAIPISITALLVPVCAVVTNIFNVREALTNFANPIIFLFLGGFALAAALRKQGLDKALANQVLFIAKGKLLPTCLLLFGTTAVLSMWVSNTATAAMMLPLAIGVLTKLGDKADKKLYTFLLLGLAYSASAGGIATLVGSPPNAIVALEMGLDFNGWLKYGLPASLILFPIIIIILLVMVKPDLDHQFEVDKTPFKLDQKKLVTIIIFAITASLWIFSKSISGMLGIVKDFDSLVGLIAIAAIGITRIADWQDIDEQTDWGVLILFGGGLTLSAILKATGVSDFIAEGISGWLTGANTWIVIGVTAAFVVFLTELSSNTASAAVLVPIFVPVAAALGVSPMAIAFTIGVAASCAFMLPIATPPNAIVFGSGHIQLREMMRIGLILNIACILTLLFFAQLI